MRSSLHVVHPFASWLKASNICTAIMEHFPCSSGEQLWVPSWNVLPLICWMVSLLINSWRRGRISQTCELWWILPTMNEASTSGCLLCFSPPIVLSNIWFTSLISQSCGSGWHSEECFGTPLISSPSKNPSHNSFEETCICLLWPFLVVLSTWDQFSPRTFSRIGILHFRFVERGLTPPRPAPSRGEVSSYCFRTQEEGMYRFRACTRHPELSPHAR